MPPEFINAENNFVTSAFIEYAKPIVGKLPEIGILKGIKIPKR